MFFFCTTYRLCYNQHIVEKETIGFIAGLVGLAAYIPCILGTFRASVRPQRAAWAIWLFEYIALFAAQASSGAGAALWLPGLQLVGIAAIFGLSFRYGIGSWDRRDRLALLAVISALAVWYLAANAALAILILVAIEAVGIALTLAKTYHHGGESVSMWSLFAIAGLIGVFAVSGQAVLYVYPVALSFMSMAVISVMLLRRIRLSRPMAVEQLAPSSTIEK